MRARFLVAAAVGLGVFGLSVAASLAFETYVTRVFMVLTGFSGGVAAAVMCLCIAILHDEEGAAPAMRLAEPWDDPDFPPP